MIVLGRVWRVRLAAGRENDNVSGIVGMGGSMGRGSCQVLSMF